MTVVKLAVVAGALTVMGGCVSLPGAECPPSASPADAQVVVDCGEAVSAAARLLPRADDPKVVRVQVVPGDFRAIYGLGGSGIHVVFTYADYHRVAVPIYVDDTTGDPIADEIADY